MKRKYFVFHRDGRKSAVKESVFSLIANATHGPTVGIYNKHSVVWFLLPESANNNNMRADFLPAISKIALSMGVRLCPRCEDSRNKRDVFCGRCGSSL